MGVGKVLEIIRDTIKDLVWRGRHERQMAELERMQRREEIAKSRLENEHMKKSLEIRRAELEKMRVENGKRVVEVASKKLDLIQQAVALELSEDARSMLLSALVPEMLTIAAVPIVSFYAGNQMAASPEIKD